MANFIPALQKVLAHEGGYGNDPNDPGGETYKGIARKMQPGWIGWTQIDHYKHQPGFPSNLEKDTGLQSGVADFYQHNFWNTISGDQIDNQSVAESIFDFGVNVGVKKSASLAQKVVGAGEDGVIGVDSLKHINSFDSDHFLAVFAIEKIGYYIAVIKNRPASKVYFYGWVSRAIADQV